MMDERSFKLGEGSSQVQARCEIGIGLFTNIAELTTVVQQLRSMDPGRPSRLRSVGKIGG